MADPLMVVAAEFPAPLAPLDFIAYGLALVADEREALDREAHVLLARAVSDDRVVAVDGEFMTVSDWFLEAMPRGLLEAVAGELVVTAGPHPAILKIRSICEEDGGTELKAPFAFCGLSTIVSVAGGWRDRAELLPEAGGGVVTPVSH